MLVNDPTMNSPATSIVPLLVTVLPFRLAEPCTSIMPSLVTVTPGPRARPGESTTIVAPARLMMVATPLVFGWGRNLTEPSLSSSAPVPAASAGMRAVPRTNSRVAPLTLAGLRAAPAATQTVARLEFTDPTKVPETNTTTSVGPRFRLVGMPLASG